MVTLEGFLFFILVVYDKHSYDQSYNQLFAITQLCGTRFHVLNNINIDVPGKTSIFLFLFFLYTGKNIIIETVGHRTW